jgi:hypothetical protein
MQYKVENDDLQSVTACFRPQDCGNDPDDGNNSESDVKDDAIYEVFLDHCDTNNVNDNDPTAISHYLEDFNLKAICNQGFHQSDANKHTPRVEPGVSDFVFFLSRVCTMNGLFFAVPLSEDSSKYSMPDKMKEMIAGFQVRLGLTVYSNAEYQNWQ